MIYIIHTLGGCGGTVLSRCIGVLPGVALFSEINPAAVKLFPHFDPLYQDRNWVRLLPAEDLDRFSQSDVGDRETFRDLIEAFYQRATETDRRLVLRDYNFVDFVGVPFCATPPQKLTLYDALPRGIPTRSVSFVRHPIDQWASLCKHDLVRDVLRPEAFCRAYAAFLDELGDIPIHRYEDFVARPESSLEAICRDLALPFDPTFGERFHLFDYVTGDFSRHKETSITAPARRAVPAEVLEEFRASSLFERILTATGYPAG